MYNSTKLGVVALLTFGSGIILTDLLFDDGVFKILLFLLFFPPLIFVLILVSLTKLWGLDDLLEQKLREKIREEKRKNKEKS